MKTLKKVLAESYKYHKRSGESEIVHHISKTDKDISGHFYPLSHFGTANAVRAVATGVHESKPQRIYSVRIKLGNVVHLNTDPGSHTAYEIVRLLHHERHITKREADELQDHMDGHADCDSALSHQLAVKHKINTISYTNGFEHPGSTSYIITHPSQVRVLRSSIPINIDRKRRGRANIGKGLETYESSKQPYSKYKK